MLKRLGYPRVIFLTVCLGVSFSSALWGQAATKPLPLHNALQDKDFYLLSLLQSDAGVRSALAADKTLGELAGERNRSLTAALRACKDDVACMVKPMLWTDEEIQAASFAMQRAYRNDAALRRLVDGRLRSSGAYALYDGQDGAELLAGAWGVCARGLNDVIEVYGRGGAPRYPVIDSISLDVKSDEVKAKVVSIVEKVSESSAQTIFFEPSLDAALQLMMWNHRDEAARLEPMESGVNEAAVKAIRTTQWVHYPYTVIVVPGAGPSDPETALSAAGRRRSQLAADAYYAGKAPFILVSGGYVHPSQTRFAEALEMKKALMNDFHVPESAIITDPHARHTTTNMRNAAREIFRYGVPMDRPALMISDESQTKYIAGETFADRCMKELGYVPYRIVKQTSETSIEFLPVKDSLEEDPMDPLDP